MSNTDLSIILLLGFIFQIFGLSLRFLNDKKTKKYIKNLETENFKLKTTIEFMNILKQNNEEDTKQIRA